MAFTILQPPDGQSEAGGAAYIRNLVTALRAAGHECAIDHGTALPSDRIAVIDGLGLTRFTLDAVTDAVGLIHHPAALAPDALKADVLAAEHALLPRLRRVIATSEAVADRLRAEFAVAPDRITVLAPGVPDAPRATGSGGPTCQILSIGALVPRKGHAVLVRALARLFDLDWQLTVVGDTGRDPEYAAALRAQVAASAAGRVHFAGTVDTAALDALWRRSDLFALATEWEGYAAPVAEALRRGVPVAVTAGGGAAERVTPSTGVVCKPGDADGLSKAVRRLIFDTALRAAMADAAWQAGQSLPSWATQAERFVHAVV